MRPTSSRYGKFSQQITLVIIIVSVSVPALLLLQVFSHPYVNVFQLLPTPVQSALPNTYRSYTSKPFSVKVTSSQTNITLTLHGNCRSPFTYAGTDTRLSLLTNYDVIGIPEKNYSPPVMNWAKVLLFQSLHTLCMNTSSWLIYSDTDAYIVSRKRTAAHLARLPDHQHFVFMNGVWFINIGFLAFRTTKEARTLMDTWGSRYIHPPKTFIDARIFARDVVNENKALCADRPNGFLGWHMKGSAKWKAPLASIGRRLANGTGDIIAAFTLVVFIATAISCLYLRNNEQGERAFSMHRPPLWFRSMLALRGLAFFITNYIFVALVALVLLAVWLVMPHGKKIDGKQVSKYNLSHCLFNGRVMLDNNYLCANGDAYICTKHRGWKPLVWRALVSVGPITKSLFAFSGILEWSGLPTLYIIALFVRAAVAGHKYWHSRTSVKAH